LTSRQHGPKAVDKGIAMVGIPSQTGTWIATCVGAWLMAGAPAPQPYRATPETPVGFRGNGTGRFPEATPPTEWSRSKNVLWKTPMPNWSHSDPVVVGEYVFTTAEPTTLVCVRRTDGKVLWQKTHDLEDTLPADRRAQAKKDLLTAERIRKIKLDPLRRKRQAITRQLQTMKEDPFLRSQKAALQRSIDALEKKLASLETYRPPRVTAAIGHAKCTPVTDGQRLLVLFGNGVAAGYDLAGPRRWIRIVRRPAMPLGHSMSPVLAGPALVMSIDKELLAVDAATGKELWSRPTLGPSGGLAAGRVGDTWVVATAEGSVVRATDGKFLDRTRNPARAPRSAPVIHKGVLYLLGARNRVTIDRLASEADGGVRLENLAAGRAFQGVYYTSPLVHDGCVFLWDKQGILSIVDAETGRSVRSKRMGLSGMAHSSPALGGKYLFLGMDDGTMAVVLTSVTRGENGRVSVELSQVAKNRLEPMRSSPVFAGKHIYVRTLKSLYCLAGS